MLCLQLLKARWPGPATLSAFTFLVGGFGSLVAQDASSPLVPPPPRSTETALFQPPDEVGGSAAAGQGSNSDSGQGDAVDETLDSSEDVLGDISRALQTPVKVPGPPTFEQAVTSVTATPSTVGRSPAAIFVITPEMIRRSGAQTLPDVLRMAPGVHVAYNNTASPNVAIRGFGVQSRVFPYSQRIQVLIDGRSIYDPVIGGIQWTANDVVLSDIERIEVIRGPGATVWGANAVNGVINIITKSAKETQGALIQGIGGSEYQAGATIRYGEALSEDSHLRVYTKYRDLDDGFLEATHAGASPVNATANDGFREFRGGFRWDADLTQEDNLSVQGTLFEIPGGDHDVGPQFGPFSPLVYQTKPPYEFSGGSIQFQWEHDLESDALFTVRGFYDRLNAGSQATHYSRDSFMIDARLQWEWAERHKWLVGAQFRIDSDSTEPVEYGQASVPFVPADRTYNVASMLIQDEIELIPDELIFIAGTKMEVNTFTGFEIQPSGRILRMLDSKRAVWGAVSRAIRRPNRSDENVQVNLLMTRFADASIMPPVDFKADALISYELGYRAQPVERFSWEWTWFYNTYDNLPQFGTLTTSPGVPVTIVGSPSNGMTAEAYGTELAGTLQLAENWKVMANYSFVQIQAHAVGVDSLLTSALAADAEGGLEGTAPHNLAYARSSWSPLKNVDLDFTLRYVDSMPYYGVDSYLEGDARIAFRPCKGLEIAFVGQNLFDATHAELGRLPEDSIVLAPSRTEVRRGFYGSVTYEY